MLDMKQILIWTLKKIAMYEKYKTEKTDAMRSDWPIDTVNINLSLSLYIKNSNLLD